MVPGGATGQRRSGSGLPAPKGPGTRETNLVPLSTQVLQLMPVAWRSIIRLPCVFLCVVTHPEKCMVDALGAGTAIEYGWFKTNMVVSTLMLP